MASTPSSHQLLNTKVASSTLINNDPAVMNYDFTKFLAGPRIPGASTLYSYHNVTLLKF